MSPLTGFLYACAVMDLDNGGQQRLRRAAKRVDDWEPLAEQAERHGLAPLVCRHTGRAGLASVLVGETIHHLKDKCDRGLTIHAAALCRDDAGIIMPGKSGAGKSSLTTWLLGRGFSYLTDELVFIPRNSLLIEAFTRPINIKSHGIEAIRQHFDFEANKSKTMTSRYVTMIPHRLLNPHTANGPVKLAMIIFPHHQRDSELELQRLTKAQVGLSLMECLVNARNLDGHGFGEATRVAREVPAYNLTYGCFDQLEVKLDAILP